MPFWCFSRRESTARSQVIVATKNKQEVVLVGGLEAAAANDDTSSLPPEGRPGASFTRHGSRHSLNSKESSKATAEAASAEGLIALKRQVKASTLGGTNHKNNSTAGGRRDERGDFTNYTASSSTMEEGSCSTFPNYHCHPPGATGSAAVLALDMSLDQVIQEAIAAEQNGESSSSFRSRKCVSNRYNIRSRSSSMQNSASHRSSSHRLLPTTTTTTRSTSYRTNTTTGTPRRGGGVPPQQQPPYVPTSGTATAYSNPPSTLDVEAVVLPPPPPPPVNLPLVAVAVRQPSSQHQPPLPGGGGGMDSYSSLVETPSDTVVAVPHRSRLERSDHCSTDEYRAHLLAELQRLNLQPPPPQAASFSSEQRPQQNNASTRGLTRQNASRYLYDDDDRRSSTNYNNNNNNNNNNNHSPLQQHHHQQQQQYPYPAYASYGGNTATSSRHSQGDYHHHHPDASLSQRDRFTQPPPPSYANSYSTPMEDWKQHQYPSEYHHHHPPTALTNPGVVRNHWYDDHAVIPSNGDTNNKNDTNNKTIEIAPGVTRPLRGAVETSEAIQIGYSVKLACMTCNVPLACIADCEMVLCPNCMVVSPNTHQYGPMGQIMEGDKNGVGLGLVVE